MKFLVLALTCLLFVSCVSNEAPKETPKTEKLPAPFRGGHLSRISLDMPKAEVIQQLGEPFAVDARNDIELFTYRDIQKAGQFEDYFVRFIDGKVESFGRTNIDQPAPNKPVQPKP